ncbi:hypothetical protein ACHAAC_09990 [Aeromicrobium sp. CF4.19]|uniref:hypothetical protein n=1 Tax=Aeromicrobium sp. CF4.19 TaxID=3373082 RepID=UPI003EE503F8
MGELVVLLAGQDQPGLDPDIVKPGWVALIVVVLLCLGVFVLVRSFAKHTRRANQPWEGDEPATSEDHGADPRD